MSLMGMLMALFPAVALAGVATTVVVFVVSPAWWSALLLVFGVYGFPLTCFHIHQLIWPIKEGWFDLAEKRYLPWWGGYHMQLLYHALPWLEGVLIVIPGAYSFWLRLWGSEVGSGVYWTPRVVIGARNLMQIGDNVIVGSGCELYCHVIQPHEGKLQLYVKPLVIGNDCVLSVHSGMTPGSSLADGTFLKVESRVYPDQHIDSENPAKRVKHVSPQ